MIRIKHILAITAALLTLSPVYTAAEEENLSPSFEEIISDVKRPMSIGGRKSFNMHMKKLEKIYKQKLKAGEIEEHDYIVGTQDLVNSQNSAKNNVEFTPKSRGYFDEEEEVIFIMEEDVIEIDRRVMKFRYDDKEYRTVIWKKTEFKAKKERDAKRKKRKK
ncbi:MAG: hypothetical protein Q4A24_10715 [Akkermansia sp.]|nr:hypothetical protein [Akkermansia sp.]